MKDLLIEILVEEIPADFAYPASLSFKKIIENTLKNNGLNFKSITSFTTPRRLSILVEEAEEKSKDYIIESKGPLLESAIKDGVLTKAGEGFLKANNIEIKNIKDIDEKESFDKPYLKELNGKKYIYVKKEKKGIETKKLFEENLENIIASIDFKKKMRWGDKDFAFVRPIRNIVALFGNEIIKTKIAGIETNNKITGHRLLSPEFVEINNPKDYEEILLKKHVIVSREKRLENIINQLEKIEKENNFEAVSKNKVSEIVVDLVEEPYLLTAEFDSKFLEVPKEVLTSEMIEHQKYFPLIKNDNNKNGDLTNIFVITANQPKTPQIIAGNIRVLTARLSDGRFLYQEDIKKGMDEMNTRLAMLMFRKELGSVADKVKRLEKNAASLIDALNYNENKDNILKAIKYMKADLVSNMVYQFPELQGIMGSYFAKEMGLGENIATAIKEQYKPLFANDDIPSNDTGKAIAILDKIDNIVAGFYVGDIPTGSQDPNALRRQALGIINILVKSKKHISLKKLIEETINSMPKESKNNKSENLINDIFDFFKSRFENDLHFSKDSISGVLSTEIDDIYDAYLKISAIDEFRKKNEELFSNLLLVFKRVKNIIKTSNTLIFEESILEEKAERELYKIYKEKETQIKKLIENKEYQKTFSMLSSLYEPLDNFFKEIMVMVDDDKLKNNRIALLSLVDKIFKNMLDFSSLIK
ncbi:glycine--tRNA ligase subunit beta [Brachyspira aalborgi]|uniref:Glycine--tRNA ligase beta subunit n=2 Tax=Brachyspira aalborgi TaxID=29522 RepID=A0A5C8F8B4_9SPIR|nr:glycine--tRNA ligase subunit beta [Brachyspira aalborgi]TXJ45789.1 glycine--tRNA ligase subunit beta [Brachyspira aalborgi]